MILTHLGYLLVLLWIREVTVEKVLPQPLDLSLTWYNEFCVKLSWNAPRDLDASCEVKYMFDVTRNGRLLASERKMKTEFERCLSLEGDVHFSVQTECNKSSRSQPVVYTIAAPTELVKNFYCFINSTVDMNCMWIAADQAPENLHLYYSYAETRTTVSNLSRCSDYLHREGKKTGCHIRGHFGALVFLQVNGTVNGSSLRNTFEVSPLYNVKPAAPMVNITKEGTELNLSWDYPEIGATYCWDYILNYSKCKEHLNKLIESKQPKANIPYDPRCQYRVQVKAVYSKDCGLGGSDWSKVAVYGEDEWSNIVIAIAIPSSVFLLVILFFCCLMKHREKMFPKIPQPSLIFKDILNSSKEQKML
uniref:Type I cytokine receptor cytokine-binding domain-containing protein n=1 Tax=Esox lucius TaxID=8010 RepID=A0A3P8YZA7_ESOLU